MSLNYDSGSLTGYVIENFDESGRVLYLSQLGSIGNDAGGGTTILGEPEEDKGKVYTLLAGVWYETPNYACISVWSTGFQMGEQPVLVHRCGEQVELVGQVVSPVKSLIEKYFCSGQLSSRVKPAGVQSMSWLR